MPIAPAVLAVAAESALASDPRAPVLAESTPFLFGAQWRVRSRIASATALADLSLSPKLMAAAKCVPEMGLAAMANAMLRRPESVERVIAAAERAAREKHAQLRRAAPDLWAKHDKVSLDSLLAILREQELKQWTEVWSASDEGELPGPLKTYSAVCNALPVRSMAPDEESSEAILGAIAAGAAAEMEALGRDLFGAEALLATRAATPEENQANAFDEAGWMLAEIERAALRNTVRKGHARDEKAQNTVAATASPLQKGPPEMREMLAWELPLVFGAEGGMGIEELISVVGIDLTASETTNAILRVASHWTLTEIASGLISADTVAGPLVDLFAQAAREAGMEIDTRRFDATSRLHARLKLQQGWRTPDGDFGRQTDDALAQGARVSICWAPNEALPTIETKGASADRRAAAQFVAGRLQSEMGKIASAVFGENAVVLAQTGTSAVEAIALLAAHAQRAELSDAAGEGRASMHDLDSGNSINTAAKPRKARSL